MRISSEVIMKSLRILALLLAVGAFPPLLMQAHGQQEVDPDHFDQPPAAQANVSTSNTPASHHAQAHKHVRTASKHSIRKPKHHQAQA
jgi:hypothetical protein